MHQPTVTLIGRDADVARLARSRAPLTLLTGDSGIGKSAVLAAAQQRTADAICPPPRTLPASGGVLQRMLIDSLGEVLAIEVQARGRVAEAGRYIVEAAERLAQQRGQELVRLIGQELLSVIRGRLGPEFGDATLEFAKSLKESVDQRLAVRLESALDRTAVEMVIAMAAEVADFLDDRGAVIAYDAGERLPETDLRVLADVAEGLPSQLRLRIAFATYSSQHRTAIDQLLGLSSSIAEVELTGIAAPAVAEWLEAEGLSAELAGDATRVTMGYPLHLADLIAHLRGGGAVEDAPLQQAFAARTDEAWVALDPDVAACARRLCVLLDPLPTGLTLQLLGRDAAEWGEIQERLTRARIFSGPVNGIPWFHEQRRRYLAEVKLTADERSVACADAARLLAGAVEVREARMGELAGLVEQATSLLQGSERLTAAVDLDMPQLSLCAALIELIEPAMGTPTVDGDQLVRYARSVFAGEGDLVAAFRRLGDGPIVHVEENEHAAVAVPTWGEQLVVFVIAGRAERELGRLPIPRAASAVFNSEVRPRIAFLGAEYGIGIARMADLGERARELRRGLGVPFEIRGPHAGPNLLLRGTYANRPFYAAITFHTEDERDAAQAALKGMQAEVFGEELHLRDALTHPRQPVPARRFLVAAELLLGGELKFDFDGTKGQRTLPEPIEAAERLTARAAALKFARSRCDDHQRYALSLEQTIGYLFYATDDRLDVAEIIGAEGARRSGTGLDLWRNDPFAGFRLDEVAELSPSMRIGEVSAHIGKSPLVTDPIIDALNTCAKRAKEYNETQPRLILPLDESELKRLISDALATRRADARAMQQSGLYADSSAPGPRRYEVDITVTEKAGDLWVDAFWSGQLVVTELAEGDVDEVAVHVGEQSPGRTGRGPGSEDYVRRVHGPAEGIVADLLGHREEDVTFFSPPLS